MFCIVPTGDLEEFEEEGVFEDDDFECFVRDEEKAMFLILSQKTKHILFLRVY